jgi:hypothetical protein
MKAKYEKHSDLFFALIGMFVRHFENISPRHLNAFSSIVKITTGPI